MARASQEIVRLVVATNDRCTINRSLHHATDGTSNRGLLWPIVRALVISCDGAYDQSWRPKTDGTISRGMQRSIARSMVT